MSAEDVLEEQLLAYGRGRLAEMEGFSPESRESLARAYALFALTNARRSGIEAAKVLCRFHEFAAAEWTDWIGGEPWKRR